MTSPRYATRQHREQRRKWRAIVDRGEGWCCEPVCLEPSRFIPPGARFDVSHDPSGLVYLGASHPRCNRSEGAARGNRNRGTSVLSPEPRRWVL